MDDVRFHHQKPHTRSPIEKRSVVIRGHKTSVSLEWQFWQGVKDAALDKGVTIQCVVNVIDAERTHGNLSSAIRLFVLDYYKQQVMVKKKAA